MKNFLYFVAGSVIGSAITFFASKTAFNKKLEEERQKNLEAVNEIISREQKRIFDKEQNDQDKDEEDPIDVEAVEKKPSSNKPAVDYTKYEDHKEFVNPIKVKKDIETIHPDRIGEDEDYAISEWIYYAGNDILVDELDEPVHGREEFVGDALTRIGEYQESMVYVRNSKYKMFYAIEKTDENYEGD